MTCVTSRAAAIEARDIDIAALRLTGASLVVDGTLSCMDREKLAEVRHRYRSASLIGERETAPGTGPLMRKHHALARRFLPREGDYLCCTTDPRVPFDNIAAEREIRMSKLRIKVSGCLRWMAGAEAFSAIRSYLATAAKHGIGRLDTHPRRVWSSVGTPDCLTAGPACGLHGPAAGPPGR